MRNIILLAVLILLPVAAFSQNGRSVSSVKSNDNDTHPATEPCTKKLADLPLFHQLRIGMKYAEVLDIYPEIKSYKHFQSRYAVDSGAFVLESAPTRNASYKEDFEQLSISFDDYKVEIFAVIYSAEKWTSLDDAVIGLSNTFGLSENNWTRYYEQSAVAACGDFKIYANSQQYHDFKRQNSMSIHPEGK